MTEAEVLSAVHGLSRHKADDKDDLNNDYYIDTSALLLLALVIISNKIMNEANVATLIGLSSSRGMQASLSSPQATQLDTWALR